MIFHHKSQTGLRRGPPCDLSPGPSVGRGWASRPHLHRPNHPVRKCLHQHFVQRQRRLGSPVGSLPQGVGREYGWQAGGSGQPILDRMSQFANSISLVKTLTKLRTDSNLNSKGRGTCILSWAVARIDQTLKISFFRSYSRREPPSVAVGNRRCRPPPPAPSRTQPRESASRRTHPSPCTWSATHGDPITHAIVCQLAQRRCPRSSRPCIASIRLRMSLVSHSTHEKDSRVLTHTRPSPNRHRSHAQHAPEIPTPARVRSSSRASRPAPDMTCAAYQRLSVT
ncbi:adenylosuccinate synthetase isozyme 1 [Striga asiatica]|uniref:Adenylosuccinate synthetase isozyme 1 n=1 Tax=Striga asiatica TaxID=4170 RepID=A0A5A7Q5I7_STRAF|nr:adenylosuccinate synthetase isozyme 1 [Striga asiatica]